MNQTKKLLLIILIIVLLLLGLGTLAATNTTHNNTIKDSSQTPKTETQTPTLQNQIQKTRQENKKQDMIVNVESDDDLSDALSTGSGITILNITQNIKIEGSSTISNRITLLTINGNNKTIDGSDRYHFLNIKSGQRVLINNLTITNCYNSYLGGAIFNEGILSFTNTNFINNTVDLHGGAIQNYNTGIMTITNTNFINNTAREYGGAIHNYNNATMSITNSNFTNNIGRNYGGAICNEYAVMNITNTNFINNTPIHGSAEGSGGAIQNKYGNMTLTNNTLIHNRAQYGGAIYNEGNVLITKSNLIQNLARYGGAIYNSGSVLITKSNLNYNYAEWGGAIHSEYNNLTITDSTLNNNTAKDKGGAIYNSGYFTTTTLTNSNITHNNAGDGGAIYNYDDATMTLINNIFTHNNATSGGGAIHNAFYANMTLNNNTLNNNTADFGGAIHNYNYANMTLNNNTLNNNNATSGGGAINNFMETKMTLNNNILNNNTASCGGAIYNYDYATMTLNNNTLNNNSAKYGGAIENYDYTTMTLNNNTLNNNSAKYGGGAIENSGNLIIRNNNFTNNSAGESGGGIYGSGNVINNNFRLNKAHNGAAIYNTQNQTRISDNTFENNVADTLSASSIVNYGKNNIIEDNINDTISTYKNTIYNIGSYVNITSNIFQDGNESKLKTKITIQASNKNPPINTPITITATLTDVNNKALPSKEITLTIDGKQYTQKTNTQGTITQTYTPTTTGSKTITAKYNGDNTYNPSNTTTTITTLKINTKLTIKVSNTTPTVNTTITITATLTDANNKNIANREVVLTTDTNTYTLKTNSNGIITQAHTVSKIDNVTITAKFNGDNVYNPSSISTKIKVQKKDTTKSNIKITLNTVKGVISENIILNATLTDEKRNSINGGNLAFKLNGKTLRSDGRFDSNAPAMKFTVKNGIVTYTIKADLYLRNAKNLTASYSGTNKYYETTSPSVTAQIQKRYAQVTVTSTPSYAKQYETLTFTIKAVDTTKNGKNNTLISDNTKVMLKVNGVTLKDGNGKAVYVTLDKNAQATYKYTIPAGTGGITTNKAVRNYTVTAIFVGDNYYPGAKNTTKFQVARSATYVNITQAKVTKTNVLSVKATLKDYKGQNIIGTNKVTIKINGKNYVDLKNGKAKYWSVKNGIVDLTGITVDSKTTIKRVMLVTGERQAYTEGRAETTNIIRT